MTSPRSHHNFRNIGALFLVIQSRKHGLFRLKYDVTEKFEIANLHISISRILFRNYIRSINKLLNTFLNQKDFKLAEI